MSYSASRLGRWAAPARGTLGLALLGAGTAVGLGTAASALSGEPRQTDGSQVVNGSQEGATWPELQRRRIIVVGGGTAGLGLAAMLRNEGMRDVTIVEPKQVHYYQPLWTLVGAGVRSNAASVKPMRDVLPRGVTWVNKSVAVFKPEQNAVTLDDGSSVGYDYLVVAAGIQVDWDKIPGLKEGLAQPESGVVSIYDYNHSAKTWATFQKLVQSLAEDDSRSTTSASSSSSSSGSGRVGEGKMRMLFTMPSTLIKCAGAPQKIMWLLEDSLRERHLRDLVSIEFWVPGASMFGVPKYAQMLEAIRKERGVSAHFKRELVSVDAAKRIATFRCLDRPAGVTEEHYDLLHVSPPMSPPDFIKASPLADETGWLAVDKHTLQSPKYPNVFGIGDCTNTPNSKTAAAVTAQAPVLVHNLRRTMEGKPLDGYYNGYASCPLIVKKNRVILAEFGYGGKIMETFSRETGKFPLSLLGQEGEVQKRFFYWLKQEFFPMAYWSLWVHGRWYGTNGPFKPDVTAEYRKLHQNAPPLGK